MTVTIWQKSSLSYPSAPFQMPQIFKPLAAKQWVRTAMCELLFNDADNIITDLMFKYDKYGTELAMPIFAGMLSPEVDEKKAAKSGDEIAKSAAFAWRQYSR